MLYYYLDKAEHAFILAIIKRREKRLYHLTELIETFPADKPLRELATLIVDTSFEELERINQKSFLLIFKMMMRFSKQPLAVDNALVVLVEPLIQAQQKNITGTFRKLNHDDCLMLLKVSLAILRRPFLEQNPIAGTAHHRELAIDVMIRLLGNPG